MIKKQFEEIHKLLLENKDKKVSQILPRLESLMSSKNQERTYLTDEDGNVIAIFCYYHKLWELVDKIEYGKKASTATGLNTMCKEGVREWTRQQNEAKKQKELLLTKITTGQISSEQLKEELDKIEEHRKEIKALPQNLQAFAFKTKEEVLKHFEAGE